MLFCLKPAAFALVVALELESKARYVVANMGSPVMDVVPLPLGAALDMVSPTDQYPSCLLSVEIGGRASGAHGVAGKNMPSPCGDRGGGIWVHLRCCSKKRE